MKNNVAIRLENFSISHAKIIGLKKVIACLIILYNAQIDAFAVIQFWLYVL